MPTTFNLPPLENGATQATIERYFHAEGAQVEQGQPLAVVVTERFEWEIPAASAGTISRYMVESGTVVAIGTPLLEIETGAASAPQSPQQRQVLMDELRATPLARRIAATHGLNLADVTGSGRGGRIVRSDVLGILQGELATSPPSTNGRVESEIGVSTLTSESITNVEDRHVPMEALVVIEQKQPQVAVTTRSTQHQQQFVATVVPHAVTAVEVDMTAVQDYVAAHANQLARRGIFLDANICVAYATINALGQHRLLNSAWHEDGIIVWSRIDLGWLAQPAATPHVIANAADLSLQGVARQLADQPHNESLPMPTFTIGIAATAFWSEQLPPVGHSATLNIGRATQRPHVVEEYGVDTIKLRPLSILTLSYDARVAEQYQADAFLLDIKQRLEHFAALC